MVTATIIEILKFCGIYTLSLVMIFLVVTAYINCYTFILDNFDEAVVKKKEQYLESVIGKFLYFNLRYVILPFHIIFHNIGVLVLLWEAVPAIVARVWQNLFDGEGVFMLSLYIGISISTVCADVILVKRRQQVMQLLWGKE